MKAPALALTAVVIAFIAACSVRADEFNIKQEYQEKADRIIQTVMAGNDAQNKMMQLCDDIGNRISGSEALDKACRWAERTMQKDGQENVRLEPVSIPKWVPSISRRSLTDSSTGK